MYLQQQQSRFLLALSLSLPLNSARTKQKLPLQILHEAYQILGRRKWCNQSWFEKQVLGFRLYSTRFGMRDLPIRMKSKEDTQMLWIENKVVFLFSLPVAKVVGKVVPSFALLSLMARDHNPWINTITNLSRWIRFLFFFSYQRKKKTKCSLGIH